MLNNYLQDIVYHIKMFMNRYADVNQKGVVISG
jgi:hypothetical protein